MPHKVSVILLSARLLCCWFVSMSSRRGTVCRVIWSILSPSGCISVPLRIYKAYPAMGTTLFPDPYPGWPIPKSPGKINLFSWSLPTTLHLHYYRNQYIIYKFKKKIEYCFLPWGCELSKGKHSAGNSQTTVRTWRWLPGLHPKHKNYQAFWRALAEAKISFQTSSSHQCPVEWTLTNMS